MATNGRLRRALRGVVGQGPTAVRLVVGGEDGAPGDDRDAGGAAREPVVVEKGELAWPRFLRDDGVDACRGGDGERDLDAPELDPERTVPRRGFAFLLPALVAAAEQLSTTSDRQAAAHRRRCWLKMT